MAGGTDNHLPTDLRVGDRNHDDRHNEVNEQVNYLTQRVGTELAAALQEVAPAVVEEFLGDEVVLRNEDGVVDDTDLPERLSEPGLSASIEATAIPAAEQAAEDFLASDSGVAAAGAAAAGAAVDAKLGDAGIVFVAEAPTQYATNAVPDPQCKTAGTESAGYTLTHVTTGLPAGFTRAIQTVLVADAEIIGRALLGGANHSDPLRILATPGPVVVSVHCKTDSPATPATDQVRARGLIEVLAYNDADTLLATLTPTAGYTSMYVGATARILAAVTLPAGTTYIRVRPTIRTLTSPTTAAAGAKCWFTGVQVDTGTVAKPYGDGDRDGWMWLGTAHASASREAFARAATFSGSLADAATNSHQVRRDALQRAKGGVIGTNGRPVVAFRIDHGIQAWLSTLWTLFKDRDLPASLGIVTDGMSTSTEVVDAGTAYTWAQLRTEVQRGMEVWNHSKTHRDPALMGTTIRDEVVGAADTIEANKLRVHGWQQPGITPVPMANYGVAWENAGYDYSAEYAQLVLGRHPLVEMGGNSLGNKMRWLPTGPGYDMPHYTLDGVTDVEAIAFITQAVERGMSVQLMLHPQFIVGGTVVHTTAMLTAVLDHVKSLRDAGTIEVLTSSGLAFADPGTSRRLDIVRNPKLTGDRSPWVVGSDTTFATETGETYAVFPTGGLANRSLTQSFSDGIIRALGLQGTTLQYECDLRVAGTASAPMRFEARDLTETDRLFQLHLRTYTVGTWRRVRFPFTLHPDQTTLRIEMFRPAGGTGSDVHVKNPRIVPV